jgi:hypothetical protein
MFFKCSLGVVLRGFFGVVLKVFLGFFLKNYFWIFFVFKFRVLFRVFSYVPWLLLVMTPIKTWVTMISPH